MSKYGLFDNIGKNETEEERKARKKKEEEARNSANKRGYFSRIKDRNKKK